MANRKLTELSALAAASLATNDLLYVVDVTANAGKKITLGEMLYAGVGLVGLGNATLGDGVLKLFSTAAVHYISLTAGDDSINLTSEGGTCDIYVSGTLFYDDITKSVYLGKVGSATGKVRLLGTTSGQVVLTAADAAGTHTIKLPTADGTSGQALTTNGSGQWGWTTLSAGTPTAITVADTTDSTCFVALFESASGDLGPKTDGGLTYNASNGTLAATAFSGPLTGDVTGNVTGNAGTVTTAAETSDTTCSIAFVTATSGGLSLKTNTNMTFNASTGVATFSAGIGVLATGFTLNDFVNTKQVSFSLSPISSSTAGTWTFGQATGTFANLDAAAEQTFAGTVTFQNTGLHVLDSNGTHDLIIKPGSNITADRTLTITTGDTDMIVNLTAVTDEYVLAYDTSTNTWRGVTGIPSTITVANEATDTTCFLAFFTAATGDLGPKTNANLTVNSSTGAVTLAAGLSLSTSTLSINGTSGTNGISIQDTNGNPKTLTMGDDVFNFSTGIAASGSVQGTSLAISGGGTFSGTVTATLTNADTNVAATVVTVAHESSGTVAAGFGSVLRWTLEDDTATGNQAGDITTTVVTATNASRKFRQVFNVWDTAAREAIRIEASGTAALVGFLGASAVVRQTGDIGTALVTFGLMSGTPTFAGANVTGTVPSATLAATITVANEATDTTCFLGFFTAATGDLGPKTNANLTFNSNAPTLTIGSTSTDGRIVLGDSTTPQLITITGAEASISVSGSVSDIDVITTGAFVGDRVSMTSTVGSDLNISDAATTSATTVLTLTHQSSGTPDVGFGLTTLYSLESSTTAGTAAADITVSWATATHASRKARTTFSVYDTAVREVLRLEASGTAAMIGFLGASAVVRQTGDIGTALVTLGLMSGTPTFAAANVSAGAMNIGTSNALTCGTIELGHASNTTISQSAAGKIAVEGKAVPLMSGAVDAVFAGPTSARTYTLPDADSTLTPIEEITTTASSSTPTPTGGSLRNFFTVTALAADATFGAPSGTPANGNRLVIRVKDNGTARALAYNAIYRAIGLTLPTTTVISKTLYLGCIYNSADSKWDVIGVAQEA